MSFLVSQEWNFLCIWVVYETSDLFSSPKPCQRKSTHSSSASVDNFTIEQQSFSQKNGILPAFPVHSGLSHAFPIVLIALPMRFLRGEKNHPYLRKRPELTLPGARLQKLAAAASCLESWRSWAVLLNNGDGHDWIVGFADDAWWHLILSAPPLWVYLLASQGFDASYLSWHQGSVPRHRV